MQFFQTRDMLRLQDVTFRFSGEGPKATTNIGKFASEFLQEFHRIQTQYITFEAAIDKTLAIESLKTPKSAFQFL